MYARLLKLATDEFQVVPVKSVFSGELLPLSSRTGGEEAALVPRIASSSS